MIDFVAWSFGIAFTLAILLFLLKLYRDRRASSRGVAGALAAPGRSLWISILGFFTALVLFPIGVALSFNIGIFDLIRFWEPGLLTREEMRWFAWGLFGCSGLTVVLFFAAHLIAHRRHLPWYARRES